MYKLLDTCSKLFVVIILGVLLLFFSFVLFPMCHSPIRAIVKTNYTTLDISFLGYNKDYVLSFLQQLTPEGRNLYKKIEGGIDIIYPLNYGFFLSFLLFLGMKKINFNAFYLCVIPLVAMFFDLCENTIIIRLINSYPNVSVLDVNLASFFTIGKYSGIVLSLLLLVIVGLNVIFKRLKTSDTSRS